jgi:hypothetical protein
VSPAGERHPDFERGNRYSEKSGAWSPRRVQEKCDALAPGFLEFLAEHAPWAAADEFAPQRLSYLRSLAVVELLTKSVVETAASEGVSAVPLRRYETLLASLRGEREALAQLGLTVRTKAQMAFTVASTEATLADLADAGRRTRGYLAAIEDEDEQEGA